MNLLPQDGPAVASSSDLLHQLQTLSWIDHTALGVLLVFFVMGLFKGLIWQVSRIGILVAAYVVAGRFGGEVAVLLDRSANPVVAEAMGRPPVPVAPAPVPVAPAPVPVAPAPVAGAVPGAATGEVAGEEHGQVPGEVLPATAGDVQGPGETTIYLAYVLLFLVVLVVLSLLAILLQKLAVKAGLGFFDRLGGGVLGVATGACVVLFGLFVVHMFFRGSQLAMAAEGSHSLRLSKRAIDWLGTKVPDELRSVFALSPLHAAATDGEPADAASLPGMPAAPGPAQSPVEIPGGNPPPERPRR